MHNSMAVCAFKFFKEKKNYCMQFDILLVHSFIHSCIHGSKWHFNEFRMLKTLEEIRMPSDERHRIVWTVNGWSLVAKRLLWHFSGTNNSPRVVSHLERGTTTKNETKLKHPPVWRLNHTFLIAWRLINRKHWNILIVSFSVVQSEVKTITSRMDGGM